MKNALVLCTGNSCRSVMTDALINHLGAGNYKAVSAGCNPAGYVHSKSIETLQRHGIGLETRAANHGMNLTSRVSIWSLLFAMPPRLRPVLCFLVSTKNSTGQRQLSRIFIRRR